MVRVKRTLWLIFGFLLMFFLGKKVLAETNSLSSPLSINPFIMSQGVLEEASLISFIIKNNPSLDRDYIQRVVATYIREAEREGVNHDIAISQMLLETGYLRYRGQVAMHQNNFGGIGALDSGEAGACFDSIEVGVRAHIQHLKAYGCTQQLKEALVDPRFYLVRRGSARTFRELTGRWATDKDYHKKIALILERVLLHHGEEGALALFFD